MYPVADEVRAAQLRSMRAAATGLLVFMAAVFVLSSLFVAHAPWLAYVRAFAEAAMVGGCADWFAVTALFRRPLGLPIPHTGIIPRKKDRIGQALGGFIADNFLTAQVLEAKLRQLEVARWGAGWLREPGNAGSMAQRIVGLLPELLDLAPPEARRDFLAAVAGGVVRAAPAAPLASSLLRAVWSQGRAQAILDRALDLAAQALNANEEFIRAQVAERSFRWLPRWVDRKIADQVLNGLGDLVEEMRAPDHPWRGQIQTAIDDFIERLATDPDLRRRAEEVKLDLLRSPTLHVQLGQILSSLEARLRPETAEAKDAMVQAIARALESFGAWLDSSAEARDILNSWTSLAIQRVVAPRRHEIGRFVAEVVAGWDTRNIVEKLELQVGGDLQYIRVNGTLIGGLAGLAIFALSRALGLW